MKKHVCEVFSIELSGFFYDNFYISEYIFYKIKNNDIIMS